MNPIDRLHGIRQEIRDLQDEANAIREMILANEVSRIGDYYNATIRKQITLKENK